MKNIKIKTKSFSKLVSVGYYIFLTLTIIYGLMGMVYLRNYYSNKPDFTAYVVFINLLPLISAFTIYVYSRCKKSYNKFYHWLGYAVLYLFVAIIWLTFQKNAATTTFLPYDFISNYNIYGYGLLIFNLILFVPLVYFLTMAVWDYILERGKKKTFLPNNLLIHSLSLAVIILIFVIQSIFIKVVLGTIKVAFLQSYSTAEGKFQQLGEMDEEGERYLTIEYYNPSYSHDEIALTYFVNGDSKFLDKNGKRIKAEDLAVGQKVKLKYTLRDDFSYVIKEVCEN